ncbi:MAG: hypothetical protein AAB225_18620, partial [Acidobacteriota bacterium]
MARRTLLILPVTLIVLATLRQSQGPAQIPAPAATAYLVAFGVGDREPAAWNGSITATGARILGIRGWRFAQRDTTDGRTNWRLSTRFGNAGSGNQGPLMENGVVVTAALDNPAALFSLATDQGGFSFPAQEVTPEPIKRFLNGRALVLQVPAAVQLTTSIEEQDFPAAAQRGDDVWVSYVEFVHGNRSKILRGQLRAEPENFDSLALPAGGDQVLLLHYSKSRRIWSGPSEVTADGQDIMRTAVGIDGQGRVWVFWSANHDGNFDVYAKYLAQGKWSSRLRLTRDPGPDLNPVAATDARGQVWVAWQGYRDDNLEVLAAVETGEEFGPEMRVSFSRASDWDPAIAAAANGDVAISWDTYAKGDYDVWFRRLRAAPVARMDEPVAVAASQNFEARSSIAFDPQNRVWVAYEASAVKWGKDFGAYEKTGVALYQRHNLRLKCFDGAQACETAASLADALPANANLLFARRLGGTGEALNTFPRLAAGPDGTVYLAFRSSSGSGRSTVGTVWLENLVYYDGVKWNGPVIFPHTDALMDARP